MFLSFGIEISDALVLFQTKVESIPKKKKIIQQRFRVTLERVLSLIFQSYLSGVEKNTISSKI